MKVLVTAGSTIVPIDKVRAISNIFSGRTGTAIAEYFARKGAEVTLITSNPSLARHGATPQVKVKAYRTFKQLYNLMKKEIASVAYDAVIHSAAVSDYEVAGVYVEQDGDSLVKIGNSGKVSSKYKNLYLRLTPTVKIIDLVRTPWGFSGILVKFKLEVGITDEELLKIARQSIKVSGADFIVANCLEWSTLYAYVLNGKGMRTKVSREQLPKLLYRKLTEWGIS